MVKLGGITVSVDSLLQSFRLTEYYSYYHLFGNDIRVFPDGFNMISGNNFRQNITISLISDINSENFT
jgi:hypothetical protein